MIHVSMECKMVLRALSAFEQLSAAMHHEVAHGTSFTPPDRATHAIHGECTHGSTGADMILTPVYVY